MKRISPIHDIGTEVGKKAELKRLENMKKEQSKWWDTSEQAWHKDFIWKQDEMTKKDDAIKMAIMRIEDPRGYQDALRYSEWFNRTTWTGNTI